MQNIISGTKGKKTAPNLGATTNEKMMHVRPRKSIAIKSPTLNPIAVFMRSILLIKIEFSSPGEFRSKNSILCLIIDLYSAFLFCILKIKIKNKSKSSYFIVFKVFYCILFYLIRLICRSHAVLKHT